jgi:hypothetical protein
MTPSPNRATFLKFNNRLFLRMGRTVPSFRLAAEIERSKWRQFRSYLDKKDRKTFDQMYDYFKLHSAACIPLKREEIQRKTDLIKSSEIAPTLTD